MEKETSKKREFSGRFWWLALIVGILAIILGIYLMVNFAAAYETLVFFVALYFIIGGVIYAFSAIGQRNAGWPLGLILGILMLIMGILLLNHPLFTGWLVVLFSGIGILSQGCQTIVGAVALKQLQEKTWWLPLILGIVILIFGILVISNPIFSVILLTVLMSLGILIFGINSVMISMRLRQKWIS